MSHRDPIYPVPDCPNCTQSQSCAFHYKEGVANQLSGLRKVILPEEQKPQDMILKSAVQRIAGLPETDIPGTARYVDETQSVHSKQVNGTWQDLGSRLMLHTKVNWDRMVENMKVPADFISVRARRLESNQTNPLEDTHSVEIDPEFALIERKYLKAILFYLSYSPIPEDCKSIKEAMSAIQTALKVSKA